MNGANMIANPAKIGRPSTETIKQMIAHSLNAAVRNSRLPLLCHFRFGRFRRQILAYLRRCEQPAQNVFADLLPLILHKKSGS